MREKISMDVVFQIETRIIKSKMFGTTMERNSNEMNQSERESSRSSILANSFSLSLCLPQKQHRQLFSTSFHVLH